jgi:hypothetical protein
MKKKERIYERPFNSEIEAGIGTIAYRTNNLQLQQLMEALQERLRVSSPNDIINLLEYVETV